MEPLFDPREFAELPEADGELVDTIRSEWLPQEHEVDEGDVYTGKRVRWVGLQGRMLRLPWDQVRAFEGNPFDIDKMVAFAQLLREGDSDGRPPLLYAPPARVNKVDLWDVEESHRAEARGELFDCFGTTRPFTTGDDELDEYLRDPEEFIEAHAADEEHEAQIRADMAERGAEALENGDGDLGKVVAQLRDGNHRAFGAQLAREPYVWVIVRWDVKSELERAGVREEDME
jgi:hypothetical protein